MLGGLLTTTGPHVPAHHGYNRAKAGSETSTQMSCRGPRHPQSGSESSQGGGSGLSPLHPVVLLGTVVPALWTCSEGETRASQLEETGHSAPGGRQPTLGVASSAPSSAPHLVLSWKEQLPFLRAAQWWGWSQAELCDTRLPRAATCARTPGPVHRFPATRTTRFTC